MNYILELVITLSIILVAASLFSNSLEYLGHRLKISDGLTGSVFAAVGTALPETLIPFIAIFINNTSSADINNQIGVGAILGAPLMLSTLSICCMAFAILRMRGITGLVTPERTGFIRDLNFFIFASLISLIAMFIPQERVFARSVLCFFLFITYSLYLLLTIRASKQLVKDGHGTKIDEPLFLTRIKFPENSVTLLFQFIIGVGLLIFGAKGFIRGIEGLSQQVGIPAALMAIIIAPIATEMPEKINSIFWIRRGKDTLAIGNITGAMVFQGSLLPILGILFTPWAPRFELLWGIVITLTATLWLRFNASKGYLRVWMFLVNGLLYLAYLIIALKTPT